MRLLSWPLPRRWQLVLLIPRQRNSPARRKQLQTYLDEAMAIDQIATDADLHEFLGIPEYNGQANEELAKQKERERQRQHRPEDLKPETFLKVIEKAKLDNDRVSEAQGFNALGLLYCESGLENEGTDVS